MLVLAWSLACGTPVPDTPPAVAPKGSSRPSASTAPSGESPKLAPVEGKATEVVLYPEPTGADPRISTTIDPAEATRVLKLVFSKFLSDSKGCVGETKTLKDARDRGLFVPRVTTVVTGSFTEPRSKQRLYTIFVGECGATHADNYGSELLVVVQGDAVIARAEVAGSEAVSRVVDLDGDGKDELLVTGGSTGQGVMVSTATLSRFEGQRLATVSAFGEVHSDNCGSVVQPKEQEVTTVTALAGVGRAPTFRLTKRKGPCK